jgi:uncharacterized protein
VSALIDDGKPRKLVLKLLSEYTIVLSRQMLAELADVITRDKFTIKCSQVDRFLSILVKKSQAVPDPNRFKIFSEDPGDDVVLNTAYTGRANFIGTGDRHLSAHPILKDKDLNCERMLEVIT